MTAAQVLSLLVALALDILIFVPFASDVPREQLDASWRYATNYGLDHHLQFGKDLIFTSGPLSFLYIRQYYPGYYAITLALSALLITAVTVGCWAVARRSRRNLILMLPVLLAQAPDFDAIFLFVPLLLLWVAAQGEKRRATAIILALLTAVCALLPLAKGSFAIAALVLCTGALVAEGHRGPRLAAALAVLFIATLSTAWLACGQAPSTLADYILSEAQIVSGYTDAMSMSGPSWQPVLFISAAAALLVTGIFGLCRRALVCVLGLAAVLFLSFKAGFVRQDGHVLIATSALLLTGLLVTLAGRGMVASLALPLAIAAWCLISWPFTAVDVPSDFGRVAGAVGQSVGAIRGLASDRRGMRMNFEAALAAIRARHPLNGIDGTVDLYPTEVAVVLANNLKWKPRPVIQSYSAYTEWLAALDAASLARPGAPDTILFQVEAIDGRYPALDDGNSWPALAARYRPVGMRGDYVELRKRDEAAVTAIGLPLVDREAAVGEKVAVPPGPVWAEIDIDPTVPGRLVSAAYKLPRLTLDIDYADGSARSFRFIASIAKAGFLLSPTVDRTSGLLALESTIAPTAGSAATPVGFSIRSDDPTGGLWRGRYRAVLRPIAFSKAPGVDDLLFIPLRPLEEDLPSDVKGDCVIDDVAKQRGDDIAVDAAVNVLNLRGWAMISASKGRANRHLSMAFLSESDGAIFTADLPKLASPGLVRYFGTSAAADAAFDADIDVRKLPMGRYRLQLVQSDNDGDMLCAHRVITIERR